MVRSITFCAVAFAAIFSCVPAFAGEASKKASAKKAADEVKKVPRWAAIQLEAERKVVSDEELAELRMEIQEETRAAREAAKEAREAAKDKTARGKKVAIPKVRVLRVLKAGFATEDAAEEFLEELKEKEAARKEKAAAAKKAAKAAAKKKGAGDEE